MNFEIPSVHIEPSFWKALFNYKLNVQKLNDSALPVFAQLNIGRMNRPIVLRFDSTAFGNTMLPSVNYYIAQGKIINYNTIKSFEQVDVDKQLHLLRELIGNGNDIGVATCFIMETFADLKSHVYYYRLVFPFLQKKGLTVQVKTFQSTDVSNDDTIKGTLFQEMMNDYMFVSSPAPSHLNNGEMAPEGSTIIVRDSVGLSVRNALILLASRTDSNQGNWQVICLRYENVHGTSPLKIYLNVRIKIIDRDDFIVSKKETQVHKVNLAHLLDTKQLADDARDLNLKLMKWRTVPQLDLDSIAMQKCLLIGAGTLGCHVARSLIAWGVRTVTFVDSANVSMSNPVRQPLYTFEDTMNGGKPKAPTAAFRLKQVLPSLNTCGKIMRIPSPGDGIQNKDRLKSIVSTLDKLVSTHDVIFLLTDSKESRWLPTVMGKAHGKIVITTALGFDTYLVARHSDSHGCYFCNDVVLPSNTVSDRTLDQVCTVTRPSIASIAAGTAVELLVSLLSHSNSRHADTESSGMLGIVPHQIRGYLKTFQVDRLEGKPASSCPACSSHVIQNYKNHGWKMVQLVCEKPDNLLNVVTAVDTTIETVVETTVDTFDYTEFDDDLDEFVSIVC